MDKTIRYCRRCSAETVHRKEVFVLLVNPVLELILTLLLGPPRPWDLPVSQRWECTICEPEQDDA